MGMGPKFVRFCVYEWTGVQKIREDVTNFFLVAKKRLSHEKNKGNETVVVPCEFHVQETLSIRSSGVSYKVT